MRVNWNGLSRLIPLFEGEGGGSGGSGAGAGEGGAGGAGEGKGAGEGAGAGEGKPDVDKAPTEAEIQAKIDAAVKDRLAREKKKNDGVISKLQAQLDELSGKAPAGGEGGAGAQPDAASQEALRTAQGLVAKANTALLNTAAQAEAMKLGVNPEFLADAVKLADLSGAMDEEGNIDTKKVSAAVDAVIKRVPALKVQSGEGGGGFRIGGEGGKGAAGGNGWSQKQQGQGQGQGSQQINEKRWNRWNS